MKAISVIVNWMLSLMALSIDTEHSPLWAVMLVVIWFACSTLLLKYADLRSWMDKFIKRYKIDEL